MRNILDGGARTLGSLVKRGLEVDIWCFVWRVCIGLGGVGLGGREMDGWMDRWMVWC